MIVRPTILEMSCSNERMAGLGEKAVYAPRPVLVSSVSNPPNRTYSSMNLSYLQPKPPPPQRSESGTSLNSASTPFRRDATCNATSLSSCISQPPVNARLTSKCCRSHRLSRPCRSQIAGPVVAGKVVAGSSGPTTSGGIRRPCRLRTSMAHHALMVLVTTWGQSE